MQVSLNSVLNKTFSRACVSQQSEIPTKHFAKSIGPSRDKNKRNYTKKLQ